MHTVTVTTREGVIVRESASFSVKIDDLFGDLIVMGYDRGKEVTCFIIVSRNEWLDITSDADQQAATA